jgi:hypothetical protein
MDRVLMVLLHELLGASILDVVDGVTLTSAQGGKRKSIMRSGTGPAASAVSISASRS